MFPPYHRIPLSGFRRLGFNLLISLAAVPFIHGSFSYPTLKSWIPDPRFPIYLDQIHRTKHGSDSEVRQPTLTNPPWSTLRCSCAAFPRRVARAERCG